MSYDEYITEASQEFGVPEGLIRAIIDAESSGNQTDENGNTLTSPAGALGIMQLMPETAQSLGVNPHDVRDNIRGGAKYLRQLLDEFGGDTVKAVAAYNAGPGRVEQYGGVPPFEETQAYVRRVLSGLGAGADPASFFFRTGQGAYGVPENTPNPENPTSPPNFWQEAKDKFLNEFYDKGIISAVRTGWSAFESMAATGHWQVPGFSTYVPTQDEIDMVDKALPNDYTAQKFVLMNAMSSDHLLRLLQMKREDRERAQRVAKYGYDATTLASIAGALLDPLMLIPMGQEAIVTRALGKLGAIGLKLSQSKLLQYSELAAQNMAAFGGDRYIAQRWGGFQPHYEGALATGAIAGVVAGYLKDLMRRGVYNDGIIAMDNAVDNMESHALALATDSPLPSEVIANAKSILRQYHDADFAKTVVPEGSDAAQLVKDGRIMFMNTKEAKQAATKLGITLQDDWKGFDIPGVSISVLNKDLVTPENLDGLIAHEVAVHGGLDTFLGKQGYEKIMNEVAKRIKNPQTDAWKKAVKTGGDPEEILGHWIEQTPKNDKVFTILKSKVDSSLRKLGLKSGISDEELRDIVQRSLKNQMYRDNPVRINPDGTMDVHGIRYSQNNIFNMNVWNRWFDGTKAKEAQKDLPWFVPKWLGRSLEVGWFGKTPYGVLANSKTLSGRMIADLLGHDPRMRPRDSMAIMPAEKIAEHLTNHWKAMFGEYYDIRNKYLVQTALTHGIPTPQRMRQFDRDVMECLNAKFAGNTVGLTRTSWEPAVEEGANKIKAIMENMWKHAQLPPERLGGVPGNKALVDPRLQAVDHEFYRVTDEEALTKFIGTYFKTIEDAVKFFTDYAKRFAKRDIIKAKLQRAEDIRYDDAKQAWEAKGKKGDPPVKQEITDKMVDEWIDEEAKNWAVGQIDRDLSRLTFEGPGRYGSDTTTFLRERFPMDTTGEMSIPNAGMTFQYDRDLRNTSIDEILPKMIKRLAGEIAVNSTLGDHATRASILDGFARELGHAEGKPGGISTAQKELELKAAHAMVDRIRGVRGFGENRTVMDAVSEFIRTKAYGDVGGNMTFAQLGELGGAMGYVGGRILMSVIPTLSNVYRKVTLGTAGKDLVEEVTKRAFGEDLMKRVWSNSASYESKSFRDVAALGSKIALVADKANEVARVIGKLTSTVNRLPQLTDRMINEARIWTVLDSIQWANGEKFLLRNPFSKWQLQAVGINDAVAENVLKADIKKYIGSGVAKDREWLAENPITYFRWKMLVDNNTMRAFIQNTVGNMSMLKEANPWTRLLFQFKDYTFRAINGQTLRALSSRQIDDALAALFSMSTNMLAYMGLTYGRALARYPHDDTKRKLYLKEQLAPWRLGVAAISRSAITGSLPGFATDAYEIATGTPMFRTTVDNTRDPGKKAPIAQSQNPREYMGNLVSNIVKQVPSATAINKTIQAPVAAYHMLTNRSSKQDIQDLINGLPLNGWLGMTYFASELKNTRLPDKTPKVPRK